MLELKYLVIRKNLRTIGNLIIIKCVVLTVTNKKKLIRRSNVGDIRGVELIVYSFHFYKNVYGERQKNCS